MKSLVGKADLEEVRSLPRAFVFIWVNWAGQARQSEVVVNELIAAWTAEQPGCEAPAYRADLSDQEGELWNSLRDWLREEGQPVNPLTFGGNGALLWLRSGKIVASVGFTAAKGLATLLAATRSIFECPAGGEPKTVL